MKSRYAEPSLHTSTTITDPERISPWGRTRPSHDPFRGQKSGRSSRCPRSAACTTATSDEPPENSRILVRHSCRASGKSVSEIHSSPRGLSDISFIDPYGYWRWADHTTTYLEFKKEMW